MKRLQLGVIGLGGRGRGIVDMFASTFCQRDVDVVYVCDVFEDRVEETAKLLEEKTGKKPKMTTNYKEVLKDETVEAVLVMTNWTTHIPISIEAMKAGKYVGLEVGGAYSVEDCWKLVDTAEQENHRFMFLENCCYGSRELMAMNMYRLGLFGSVVHCEGQYRHDLRAEITGGKENRHYRLGNYMYRNCENYPTHELGPIAKLLDINNGNRMVSLTSTASCSKGLHEYVLEKRGKDDILADKAFLQGDVVTTVIKCEQGQTILLKLDTTLPSAYSRNFTVRGTKGAYFGELDSVLLDGEQNEFDGRPLWENAEKKYFEMYKHPIWKDYIPEGGHDGMDTLVYGAFVEAAKSGKRAPIDVYDGAAYMCITALSEQSIALGGMPVFVPDFTKGFWYMRRDIDFENPYCLDRKQEIMDSCL